MLRIDDLLPLAIMARMFCNDPPLVEDTHLLFIGHHHQVASYRLGRNRVVIQIEANIRGFADTDRQGFCCGKRLMRQGQQCALLFGKDFAHATAGILWPSAIQGVAL